METLEYYKNKESIDSLSVEGDNRNSTIGLHVHVDQGCRTVLNGADISNVFVGIIKTGDGELVINEDLIIHGFGGDFGNVRGSNVQFVGGAKLVSYDNTPTRPYNICYRKGVESVSECLARHNEFDIYDESLLGFEDCGDGRECIKAYHQDTGFQIYAVKNDGYTIDHDGLIENIIIPDIDIKATGEKSQGFIASEGCDIASCEFGTKSLSINMDYKYPFLFNTLRDSKIGNESDTVDGSVRVDARKKTNFESKNLTITNIDVIGFKEPEKNSGIVGVSMTLKQHASRLEIEHEVLLALVMQESDKTAFRHGMPVILFECHVYDRSLRAEGIDPADIIYSDPSAKDIICYSPYKKYGSPKKQVTRYEKAKSINANCAIKACSWGKFQVLGENYEMCGFESAQDFRDAMDTEQGQLDCFISYIESKKGLIEALRNKDWRNIKKLYQGSKFIDKNKDGEDDYVANIIRNYTRVIQSNSPRKPLVKSRTMKNNVTGAVVKAGTGAGVIYSAEPIIDAVTKLSEQVTKIEDVKDKVTESLLKVDTIARDVGSVQESLDSMSWMPIAIGVLLILAIYPHIRIAFSYLQDNGYISTRGDLSDY